jgi:glycosyltransferase involved in cell wall biosynthesis
MISVICPIYNEERRIEACIQSIVNQDYPHDEMEVLFVDGMSTDRTRDIVMEYGRQYPFIRLLDNPMHTAPVALNTGIRAAQGDIIVRLDAHSKYPADYFPCWSTSCGTVTRTMSAGFATPCRRKRPPFAEPSRMP